LARNQAGTAPFVNCNLRFLPYGWATSQHPASIDLKNEIYATVPWRVEILNETVAAEIAALPADMQARFLRLADRIASAGLNSLGEPHVKHLEGKLWELRLTGRDGIARALYVTAIGQRVVVVRAFVKKTQRTPRAEIELALKRAKEIT
jgi:phage-related protein